MPSLGHFLLSLLYPIVCSCACTHALKKFLNMWRNSGSEFTELRLRSFSVWPVPMIWTYKLNCKYVIEYFNTNTPKTQILQKPYQPRYALNILCDRSLYSSLSSNHLSIPLPIFQIYRAEHKYSSKLERFLLSLNRIRKWLMIFLVATSHVCFSWAVAEKIYLTYSSALYWIKFDQHAWGTQEEKSTK